MIKYAFLFILVSIVAQIAVGILFVAIGFNGGILINFVACVFASYFMGTRFRKRFDRIPTSDEVTKFSLYSTSFLLVIGILALLGMIANGLMPEVPNISLLLPVIVLGLTFFFLIRFFFLKGAEAKKIELE
jgi:hypothetical protein